MDKYDKLVELTNLVNSCLLPELKVDVGEENINLDHFNDFRTILDQNLVALFDMIQANEHILIEDDGDSINFQVRFVLLLCEQTSPYSLQWHQTKNTKLLKNVEKLIEKHFKKILSFDQKVNKKIFEHYKSKLVAGTWKKNIGCLFGFLQFLVIKYNRLDEKLEENEITFVLSVGLLLQDFFDPVFKKMAIEVFNILLNRTKKEHLIQMNIHNVIYEELRRDIYKDSVESIQPLWNNLILCLKIKNFKYTYEKFTEVDYLVKDLLHQIVIAKSFEIWLTLINILIQLFLEYSLNTTNIESLLLEIKDKIVENIDQLRVNCFKIEPQISYRWTKTILECLISESNYLMGVSDRTVQVLNKFHLCYLICILPLDLNICDDLINIFWNKFSAILMEVIRLNKSNIIVYDSVKEFFKTFIYHIELQKENICDNLKIKHYDTVFNEIMECIDGYV